MFKLKFIISFIFIFVCLQFFANSDESVNSIPSVKLKNLMGETIDSKTFSNDGKPFIINFWATWCKACIQELSTIHEIYPDWQKETGVKVIAVSIDDSRSSKRVPQFINSRGWKFEVYLDENSDFKRAMNVSNPPHTFLCNGKGEIVWQHNAYAPGDEDELYSKVKELINQKK
jgi:cytochrome c biogenesis protein CcmG, thiol:disulfide interchange protein DsbE